jgi:hypothetical protein
MWTEDYSVYEVITESSWTVIIVTASVKEAGMGGQGPVNMFCFHASTFSTTCLHKIVHEAR